MSLGAAKSDNVLTFTVSDGVPLMNDHLLPSGSDGAVCDGVIADHVLDMQKERVPQMCMMGSLPTRCWTCN